MESLQAFAGNQTKRDFDRIYSYKCLQCPAKFQQIQEVETHSFREHFNFGGDIQWQKSSEINLESLQESLTSEQSQPENKKTAMEESNGKFNIFEFFKSNASCPYFDKRVSDKCNDAIVC